MLLLRSVKGKLFFSVASNVLALLDDDDIVTSCEITPHILLYVYVFHEIDIDVAQTSFTAIIALIDGGPVFITTYVIISYQILSKLLHCF